MGCTIVYPETSSSIAPYSATARATISEGRGETNVESVRGQGRSSDGQPQGGAPHPRRAAGAGIEGARRARALARVGEHRGGLQARRAPAARRRARRGGSAAPAQALARLLL